MAKCKDCQQDMSSSKTNTCTHKFLVIDGAKHERNTDYYDVNKRCHDCNIVNGSGNVHHFGCDVERCPVCKGQLISCGHGENAEVKK